MMMWALLPLLAGTSWLSPVATASVQSEFTPSLSIYGSGHRGIDLAAAPGTSVRAVSESTVALAGKVAGKPVVVLLVDDPRFGRLRVTYEPVLPEIKVGDRLVAGQPIGVLAAQGGHCGRSPHCLHLGIKQDDRYLNPSSFIGSGRVVLKPTG